MSTIVQEEKNTDDLELIYNQSREVMKDKQEVEVGRHADAERETADAMGEAEIPASSLLQHIIFLTRFL